MTTKQQAKVRTILEKWGVHAADLDDAMGDVCRALGQTPARPLATKP